MRKLNSTAIYTILQGLLIYWSNHLPSAHDSGQKRVALLLRLAGHRWLLAAAAAAATAKQQHEQLQPAAATLD